MTLTSFKNLFSEAFEKEKYRYETDDEQETFKNLLLSKIENLLNGEGEKKFDNIYFQIGENTSNDTHDFNQF